MHLKLLDHAGSFLINLEKCRNIIYLSILYKILHNVDHPLYCKLPQFAKPIRITWHITQQNDRAFIMARYKTLQFFLSFTYYNSLMRLS